MTTLTLATLIFLIGVFVGTARSGQGEASADSPAVDVVPRALLDEQETLARKRLAGWHRAELQRNGARARARVLLQTLLHRPSVSEAINLAGTVYGSTSTLWRKARCESHLFSGAHNSSGASGLLQFLPSTWASTPFAGFSVFSPYANALAAGWMHANGRGGEWSCP